LSARAAWRRAGASIFCVSLFCTAVAGSQHGGPSPKSDYALIYGTVWGPDDRPVPGIRVNIRKATDKKPRWELVSDRSGEFAQRVPVGAQDYIVRADLKLPKGRPQPEVKVHIDDNERQDIGLHLTEEQLPSR
jgi:hypothetical protein